MLLTRNYKTAVSRLTFILNIENKTIESQGGLNIKKLYGQKEWTRQQISREQLINERLIRIHPTGQNLYKCKQIREM